MPGAIIVPTDFSTASETAISVASDVAKAHGAKLLIVHVVEPPFAYGDGNLYYGFLGPDDDTLKEMLHEIHPTSSDVSFEHRMLNGHAAQAIVDLARDENAEMIVIGSHARHGLGRMVLGSVAEVVVRHATCPVLVVKDASVVKPKDGEKVSALTTM